MVDMIATLACLSLLFVLTGCASSEPSKARGPYSDLLTASPSDAELREPQRNNLAQRIGNALIGFGNGVNRYRPQTQVNVNPQPTIWMQNIGGKTYNCNNIGGTVNCH